MECFVRTIAHLVRLALADLAQSKLMNTLLSGRCSRLFKTMQTIKPPLVTLRSQSLKFAM